MTQANNAVAILDHPHPAILEAVRPRPSTYNLSIGYLRAFVTLMVVAHHAVLAYHPDAPPSPASLLAQPRWWQAFPVVDSARWSGFSLLVGFNDVFFMALMFFLSGLFVWPSQRKKGAGHFLRDRFVRLGLPFTVAAAVIAPLAYYPTYLQSGGRGISGFFHVWASLGNWPAGPAWFIWVLLAFDCLAAALFVAVPASIERVSQASIRIQQKPIVSFLVIVGISALAYLTMVRFFNPFYWSSFGPFTIQTSRALHYLVYFLAGMVVGACGTDRGLIAADGKLARRWFLWVGAALLVFVLELVAFIAALAHLSSPSPWSTIANVGFSLSCAASSLAFLAVFLRFAKKSNRIFDSLSVNAYGIYLIHYAFVSWLQYSLLGAHLAGAAKGVIVFSAAALLSWASIVALRKVPAVARVI